MTRTGRRGLRTAAALLAGAALTAGCSSGTLPGAAGPEAGAAAETAADSSSPATPAGRAAERAAERATVRIRVSSCQGRRTGTGFHIGSGIIVTNRHVIDGSTSVSISTWDGQDAPAETVHIAEHVDLALLRIPAELLTQQLTLAEGTPGAGQRISVIGHPEGGPLTTDRGSIDRISDGTGVGEDAQLLLLDVQLRPGNSGGPVIDLATGETVGAVFAYEQTGQQRGLAISADDIRQLTEQPARPAPTATC